MPRFAPILVMLLALCLAGAGGRTALADPGAAETIDAGQLLKMVADNKGKVFVVNVFASWCPPCRDEIPGLVNVRRAFPEDTLRMLGVSVDKEPKALAAYMKELSINYPVRLARGDFIQRVGVTAVPQLLIYNKKGELAINHRGLVDEEDLKNAINDILAE